MQTPKYIIASLDVGQNLETMVLTQKKIGIRDLDHFEFVDPPPLEALMRAVNVLYYLGVLDDFGNLTELGEIMSEFPVDPQTLVVSPEFNCSNEILSISAMLSGIYIVHTLLVVFFLCMSKLESHSKCMVLSRLASTNACARTYHGTPLSVITNFFSYLASNFFVRPTDDSREAAKAQFAHGEGDHLTLECLP